MFTVRLSEKKTIVLAGSLKRGELATLWFKLTLKNWANSVIKGTLDSPVTLFNSL
jgi:hypothetical protein